MSLTSQISPQAKHVPASGGAQNRTATVDRRAALFRESLWETCQRVALGAAWALRAKRVANLLPLARVWLNDHVDSQQGLPDSIL